MDKFTSIIITHFASNAERSLAFKTSINSLLSSTKLPMEIIVVDNGGNIGDSQWLLELAHSGRIHTYIRNSQNMHFGYARTQALRICNGDYICIADNDINYYKGWLESCLAVLDAYPEEKIYATPVYNVAHWLPKFWTNRSLEVNGKPYRLNSRAGSNCFVIRRKDMEQVGEFLVHRIAGTKWTEEAISKGYLAAVCPEILIDDMGFRNGYNFKEAIPVKEILSNGEEVYFNRDEFRRNNPGLHYSQQKRFNPGNRQVFVEYNE